MSIEEKLKLAGEWLKGFQGKLQPEQIELNYFCENLVEAVKLIAERQENLEGLIKHIANEARTADFNLMNGIIALKQRFDPQLERINARLTKLETGLGDEEGPNCGEESQTGEKDEDGNH